MQTFVLPSEALASETPFDDFIFDEADSDSLRFHGVKLKDFYILIEEKLKSEIIELQDVCKIPFTPNWLVGKFATKCQTSRRLFLRPNS